MTLSFPTSRRLSVFALALIYSTLTIGAVVSPGAAQARDNGPYYIAELAAPVDDNRTVAGGVAWSCKGTTCYAGKGNSRPLRICRGIQREFGEVTSFTAQGKQLPEDKLADCNGE
ncbi:CC_3452 family protein [Altererythrobacter sp.]|uniref:CC_3452 family protein n=1 Tax=Altererythrobacter sp. TaxID=1872480 RepID=UPI003D09360C